MKLHNVKLNSGETRKLAVSSSTGIQVTACDSQKVLARTNNSDTFRLINSLGYRNIQEFTELEITNPDTKQIEIEFYTFGTSVDVKDSRASFAGAISVQSQSAGSSLNTQFDITDVSSTRVLDLNTGRKSALIYNNSENSVFIKSYDAIDVIAKGIPLMPKSSMTINTVQPIFAKTETGLTADLRIYEESY